MRTLLAMVVGATTVAAAHAQSLSVGDKAPTLRGAQWLQGEPAPAWEDGKVYVLDFWATWCKPCIDSIPHLTELQARHAADGVVVVGVAIWPQSGMTPTADFVREMGEKMPYRIAEDVNGSLARAFMEASGQSGIPTAMVVERTGRVAWIGHPMAGLDKVVRSIVAGEFDVERAAQATRERAALERKAQPILQSANALASQGKFREALVKVDELIAMGFNRSQLTLAKAQVLMFQLGDVEAGYAHLREAVGGTLKDDAEGLQMAAWFIADAPNLPRRDMDLALQAAERAVELTESRDPAALDVLARVHFDRGDHERAAATIEKAVPLATGEMRAELERTLAKYRAAAGGGAAAP